MGVLAGVARAEPDRYRALIGLIQRNPATGAPVDSLDELLPLVDEELRANFTLVYASRSPLADVEPLHPRVILFARDARLIVAFTGDPLGANRDVVELIHFRDEARAFELDRFVLPAAARRDPTLAALARDNGRPDPAPCRRCHGADPRPIIDSYFLWPGFYGSVQDRFVPDGEELRNYRAFLSRKDAPDSVYRWLRFVAGSPVPPYFLDPALVESTRLDLQPNTRLGMALTELNRKRIARRIESSPRYPLLRDRLLSALLDCAPLPLDAGDAARMTAALASEDRAKLDRQGATRAVERDELQMAELGSVENLAALDYLARALDVSRGDWSMALEPGSLALYDGILSGELRDNGRARDFYFKEDLLLELLRPLAARDAIFARYFAVEPFFDDQPFGARLDLPRARGLCAQLDKKPVHHLAPAVPAVAYRCVRCHEPNGEAPPIPFDSPSRLHALLAHQPTLAAAITARVDATDPNRMPIGDTPLTPAERAQLLEYVWGHDPARKRAQ